MGMHGQYDDLMTELGQRPEVTDTEQPNPDPAKPPVIIFFLLGLALFLAALYLQSKGI